MNDLTIERLSPADVADNVALSAKVGWKDAASDWRVLHEAALVLGVRREGQLVAQGCLGGYGAIATLAKMVVAPELQRSGLGSRILDALLAEADARRMLVGLCAAPPGQKLYESRGFETVSELVVMTGEPRVGTSSGHPVVTLSDASLALELDRRFCGCDRSRMLRARWREASAAFQLADGSGYALATTQGESTLVGPIIASDEQRARSLASAVLCAQPGPVRVDVPAQQQGFRRWLAELGLRELGTRPEMARGISRLPWQAPERFALATQAWG
jgi:GNAT superfamily N-acetyltransferase